jgi:uncharacterized protein (TIGR03382 family)
MTCVKANGEGKMRKNLILICVACFGMLASSAVAAPLIPWTVPNGAADDFTYTNGGSDTGLFGQPTIIGNSFFFFPAAFRAEATNGGSDIANDRIDVRIQANPGFNVTGVIIQEFGDYQLTGSGDVSVTGQLQLTNLNIPFPPQVRIDPLSANPGSVISGTNISGPWDAESNIDLSGETISWSRFSLILSNELSATADAGSTASIEKTFAGGAVVVTVIPEPATVTLAVLGVAGLLARRRHTA